MNGTCRNLLLSLVALPATLHAGGVMEMASRADPGAAITQRISAQDGRLRVDTFDAKGQPEASMLFVDGAMITVDHDKRRFTRMDDAAIEALAARTGAASAQMSQAMRQMQEQLASMPPEQRAMVEKMMAGQMRGMTGAPAQAVAAPRVTREGADRWQDNACTKYRVEFDGGSRQELCAAAPGDIPGATEVLAAFKGMRSFQEKLLAALPKLPFTTGVEQLPAAMDSIDGIPVYTRQFEGTKLRDEHYLAHSEQKLLPASLFAPPEGYREEPVM